jgi:16S rRNA (adenine1518-N6/adenine1519-N6)-dimethyltransferase
MPRRLGQHFLRSESVLRLLSVIAPAPDDCFLEIGPGRGALTLPLASKAGRIVAIELDSGLARALRARAPQNVTIVEGDALTADLRSLVPAGARLVGNLPYYISSPLLRRFLDLADHLRDMNVMLQEEVAVRVASPPGSRDYGILSVLYALFAEPVIALRFPPEAFVPPPKVNSAVLRVQLAEPGPEIPPLGDFERFLGRAFARRRRTLENNLQDSYANLKHHLRFLDIEGTRRPETLSVVEFVKLYRALSSPPTDEPSSHHPQNPVDPPRRTG